MNDWIPIREFLPERLHENLLALQSYRPALFSTVSLIIEKEQILLRMAPAGYVECGAKESHSVQPVMHESAIVGGLDKVEPALSRLSDPSTAALVVVVGWGLGYAFHTVWDKGLLHSKYKIVLVVEPDIRLFSASLAIHPLQELFSNEHVLWCVGTDWQTQLKTHISQHHLFAISKIEVIFSEQGQESKPNFLAQEIRGLMERERKLSHQVFLRQMQEAQHYYSNKSLITIHAILAIDFKGGFAVSYIYRRFLEACEAQGIKVLYHRSPVMSGIDLLKTIAEHNPDCLILVNLAPENYAPLNILDKIRIPRMVWFLDDPQNFMRETTRFTPQDFLFSWDMSHEPFLRERGAQSIDYFPYVADLDKIDAQYIERYQSPISFIGQVGYFDYKEHGLDENTGQFIERLGYEKSLSPATSYGALVWKHQQEFGLRILERVEDPVPQSISYGIYVVGNALRRIRVLETVMKHGLKLYGNEAWLDVLGDHPLRDCYQGPADPTREAPHIFVSSQINLNIHSLHALHSLNQRDFNCPLVGGFLLTDWVEGADKFFLPGREMIFYQDLQDLESKVDYYLQHPEAREQVIQEGQKRVLREHTYEKRAPRIIQTLQDRIQQRYYGNG